VHTSKQSIFRTFKVIIESSIDFAFIIRINPRSSLYRPDHTPILKYLILKNDVYMTFLLYSPQNATTSLKNTLSLSPALNVQDIMSNRRMWTSYGPWRVNQTPHMIIILTYNFMLYRFPESKISFSIWKTKVDLKMTLKMKMEVQGHHRMSSSKPDNFCLKHFLLKPISTKDY